MLLRSGMTVRQAITYNMVSSVLAFTGMCLGIVLGTLDDSASSWVFSLTAGIFIYVSLVDMVTTNRHFTDTVASISRVLDSLSLVSPLPIISSSCFRLNS